MRHWEALKPALLAGQRPTSEQALSLADVPDTAALKAGAG